MSHPPHVVARRRRAARNVATWAVCWATMTVALFGPGLVDRLMP